MSRAISNLTIGLGITSLDASLHIFHGYFTSWWATFRVDFKLCLLNEFFSLVEISLHLRDDLRTFVRYCLKSSFIDDIWQFTLPDVLDLLLHVFCNTNYGFDGSQSEVKLNYR